MRRLRPQPSAPPLNDPRARYIGDMDKIYVLLIFAAAIAIIFLAGRWNTSDVDHYMGFDNLRSRRKRQAPSEDADGKEE